MNKYKVGDKLENDNNELTIVAVFAEDCYAAKFNDTGVTATFSIEELNDREYKLIAERWKPEEDKKYWVIYSEGSVNYWIWNNACEDNNRYDFGNIFQSKSEAEEARDKIKTLLTKEL